MVVIDLKSRRGVGKVKKGGGIIVLLLILAVVYFMFFAKHEGYPNMNQAVFLDFSFKHSDTVGQLKMVLNPDKTCTMNATSDRGDVWKSSGVWELNSTEEVHKVTLQASNGFSGTVSLYKNKESSYVTSDYNFFGTWYQ